MADQTRENNPNWKGGRVVDPRGYVLVRVGVDHPMADVRGYAYEHRLNAAKFLGRDLEPGEEVHHKGERWQNTKGKIEVLPMLKHHEAHRKRTDLRPVGAPNPVIQCACGCGTMLKMYDEANRPRRYLPSHNLQHPSPTCDAIANRLETGPKTIDQLERTVNASRGSIKTALTRMRKAGTAKPIRHGVWAKEDG